LLEAGCTEVWTRKEVMVGGRNHVTVGGAILLSLLFFIASRDALQKYYARTGELLGITRSRKDPYNDERLAFEED
jgi:hypothetical protein